jgi:hypothetical protein
MYIYDIDMSVIKKLGDSDKLKKEFFVRVDEQGQQTYYKGIINQIGSKKSCELALEFYNKKKQLPFQIISFLNGETKAISNIQNSKKNSFVSS